MDQIKMYMVTENMYSAPAKNVDLIQRDGLFYVNFDTCLQSLDVLNRNKRMYDLKLMLEALVAEHIREMQSKGGWCGEAGHPITKDPARLMTIDPKLVSHRINKTWNEGNLVFGNVDTLDNDYGRQFTKLILQKVEPAFSLRAMCPMQMDARGIKKQTGKAFIVTYDWVFYPSHKEAYRDERTNIKQVNQSVLESGNQLYAGQGSELIVTESSIVDYIASQSKSVKLVSNVCEFVTENMSLTDDLRFAILKDSSDTIYVPIEKKIVTDIRSYMSNF